MHRIFHIVAIACVYAFVCVICHPIYNTELDDPLKYTMRVNDPIISPDFVITLDEATPYYEEFQNFGKNDFNKRMKKLNASHLSFAEPLKILKEKADNDRTKWLVHRNKQAMYDKGKRLSNSNLDNKQDDVNYRMDVEAVDAIENNQQSCCKWIQFLQEQSSQNNLEIS